MVTPINSWAEDELKAFAVQLRASKIWACMSPMTERAMSCRVRTIASSPTSVDLAVITSGLEGSARVVVEGQYEFRQNSLASENAPQAPAVANRDRVS
jgi:hypothetical protein